LKGELYLFFFKYQREGMQYDSESLK